MHTNVHFTMTSARSHGRNEIIQFAVLSEERLCGLCISRGPHKSPSGVPPCRYIPSSPWSSSILSHRQAVLSLPRAFLLVVIYPAVLGRPVSSPIVKPPLNFTCPQQGRYFMHTNVHVHFRMTFWSCHSPTHCIWSISNTVTTNDDLILCPQMWWCRNCPTVRSLE